MDARIKLVKERHILGDHFSTQWPILHACSNGWMVFVQGNNSVMLWEPDEQLWRHREYGALSDLMPLFIEQGYHTYVGLHAWEFMHKWCQHE